MPLRVDAAIRAALGGVVPPVATLPASRCGSLAEVLVLVLLVWQCDWRASEYPLMHGQIFQTWSVIEPVVYDGVNVLRDSALIALSAQRSARCSLDPQ